MTYITPHSPEWFKALEALNPMQAALTKQIIELAGKQTSALFAETIR